MTYEVSHVMSPHDSSVIIMTFVSKVFHERVENTLKPSAETVWHTGKPGRHTS